MSQAKNGKFIKRRHPVQQITYAEAKKLLLQRLGADTPEGCLAALNNFIDQDNAEIARRVGLIEKIASERLENWSQVSQDLWTEIERLQAENEQLRAQIKELEHLVENLRKKTRTRKKQRVLAE